MKAKLCFPLIFVTLLSNNPQCHAEENTNNITQTSSSKFAWELFQNTKVSTKDTDNLVISPLTVQHLISVLQYAAEGTTKEQITQVTNNISPATLYYMLHPVGASREVKSANGIFIDSNDRVSENASLYITANGGDIFMLPLQKNPDKAKQFINTWVSNGTEGHIPQLLGTENDVSNLRAFLASAIFFHSTWKHQFRSSKPRKFYTMFNEELLTDYMEVNSYFKMKNVDLGENNWATVINLPYKENRFSMFLIIPDPFTNLITFLEKMNYRKFSEIIKNPSKLPTTKLNLFMPKFKISSKISLVPALQKMGLVDIFTSQSRLTKLIDGNQALRISEVLQQSTLEVDQFGTTATSVTTVSVVPLSAAEPDPQVFVLDTPFLAVIVENANETPLFIARITNPDRGA